MSNDTVFQLSQVLGKVPLDAWKPPVMSLLWRELNVLTLLGCKHGRISDSGLLVVALVHQRCNARFTRFIRWSPTAFTLGLSP